MSGKFDSVRDEILSLMVNEGWANESDGNVESITGFFARISNDESEVIEIIDAFAGQAFEIDPNFDVSELLGFFLLEENEMGFVYVTEFNTDAELIARYTELSELHHAWETN